MINAIEKIKNGSRMILVTVLKLNIIQCTDGGSINIC